MKAIRLLGKIYTPAWMLMGAETFFHALQIDEKLVGAIFGKIGQVQYDTFLRLKKSLTMPGRCCVME